MSCRVVITGSSGRIGRALHWKLSQKYKTEGIDISPSSATSIIGDICNYENLLGSFENVQTVFHTAALHAPHVEYKSEKEFYRVNVEATENICKAALAMGVSQIIFTSTTALYGYANQGKEKAVWVNEQTIPKPKTIYHKTKLEAEKVLEQYAGSSLNIRIIRMSRCFPEAVQKMAVYRLHRGVDYRDVAEAHILASRAKNLEALDTFVVSGKTPFLKTDLEELARSPEEVIRARHPKLADEFIKRGWNFPKSISRVYDPSYAGKKIDWESTRSSLDVINQFDNADYEVLPNN